MLKFFLISLLIHHFICENYKYKISVIIPIYKAQKYLRECLTSIINQTLKEIQIICINDGSRYLLKILEEFGKKDKRILIKYIQHSGIPTARNEGLKYVEGEYIGFVDDDDFIDPQQYEKIYEYAKKDDCDFVGFGDLRFYEKNKFKYKDIPKLNYSDSIVNTSKYFHNYKNEIWNKIYKSKIIKENNLDFEQIGAEDLNFNLKFYPFVKKHKFINTNSYYYRLKKRSLYPGREYLFGKSFIFFNSLNDFYHKINLDKNDPILFLHLLLSGYENLYYDEDLRLNKEYLKIFFDIINKLDFFDETLKKLYKNNVDFYYYLLNAYNKIKKEEL